MTEQEYTEVMAAIDALIALDPEPGTEGAKKLDALSDLVVEYEDSLGLFGENYE